MALFLQPNKASLYPVSCISIVVSQYPLTVAQRCNMAKYILGNIGWGIGLLPDGTKPQPESTYHEQQKKKK